MKTIVVACGSGIATSTVICEGLENLLKENGIAYNIIQCSITELKSYVGEADMILSSMPLSEEYGVAKAVGLPYLTGMGVELLNENILNILKEA